jgi:FKBP-type peptidyl-prolyl cis-trans isomerase FkpA
MEKSIIVVLFSILILSTSCDDQLGMFGGPVYDVEGNLAIDRVRIAEYLETAAYDSLYRVHDRATGVVVIVQEEGVGSRPRSGNVIYSNYTGKLTNGNIFDTNLEDVARANDIFNEERNYDIFTFFLGQPASQGGAIEGFSIGFRKFRSGGKGVIIIPSPYGYRDNPNIPNIPENSVLVFEVELLGFD